MLTLKNRITELGKMLIGHRKPLRCARYFGAHILSCEKVKTLDLQIFSQIEIKNDEKVAVNLKYYHEHQRT